MNKYLLVILMLVSANAFPSLIKWVDADGQVHYSDVPPPPDARTKILRSTSNKSGTDSTNDTTPAESPAAGSSGEPKSAVEREAELKKAQQEKKEAAEKAAKEQAKTDEKKAYCDSLNQNLRTLQQGVRIVEVDAKGERSFLEDEQRQQRIAKVQQDISTNCK